MFRFLSQVKLPCWLINHAYKTVAVNHYNDVSYDGNAPSTHAVLKCVKCGRMRVESLYGVGYLTLEQLNG